MDRRLETHGSGTWGGRKAWSVACAGRRQHGMPLKNVHDHVFQLLQGFQRQEKWFRRLCQRLGQDKLAQRGGGGWRVLMSRSERGG